MAGKFHLKKAVNDQFHFNLHAANGEIILSSEQYKAKRSALNGIESVRKNAQREGAFQIKIAKNGKHYFILKATNGQVIGQSQMYANQANAQIGIDSIMNNAPKAPLRDDTA